MAWHIDTLTVPHVGWKVMNWSLPGPGIWGLSGPNGSGKSQFLSQLVAWSNKSHGPRVGLVMQNSRLQLTEATVWDQMIWPFRKAWRKAVSSALISRAEELLEEWHLEDYRAAQPWELSGGMQRRLALASMEMLSPQVYLLDEPLEGLDVEHRLLFATKIAEWSTTVPVVVCSHSWQWLLLHTEWGWWCDNGLTWGRMGDLWYRYGHAPGSPLEELWRQLLDAGAPVAPEAWVQSDRARKEVIRLWNSRSEIPSTH